MTERPAARPSAKSAPSTSAALPDTDDRVTSTERSSNSADAAGRVAGATIADKNAQESGGQDVAAAVAVTQAYFSAINRGDYRTAWHLWERDGAASGMSAADFAASFAKFVDYRADIGTPGRVDSGAGQRYVTVPVSVAATLRDGRPATLKGDVVLHRTAAIDGATAAQQRWHIYQSNLRPRPD
ncbi:hypothetical protein F1C10_00825 [Sphingomonas sp. NBWT7]|nr:hypothetical protein F1C10_00825 [Sphingomonas sp. NBWT7]